MPRNKTPGDAMRRGAVKPRSQVKNEVTGTWTKREGRRERLRRAMDHHIAEGLKEPPSQVTRFEVIDRTGDDHLKRRAFVKYGVSIELSYQDDGRTLKVFVTPREPAIDVTDVQAALDRVAKEVREEGPQDGRVKRKEVGE